MIPKKILRIGAYYSVNPSVNQFKRDIIVQLYMSLANLRVIKEHNIARNA